MLAAPNMFPCAGCRRECLSEMLGTFMLVLVGPASVIISGLLLAQSVLVPAEALVATAFAFGATVSMIIWSLGRYSDAHANPSVTVALTVAGRFNGRLLAPYLIFQIVGGVLAGFALKVLFQTGDAGTDLGSTKLATGVEALVGIGLEATGTFVLTAFVLLGPTYITTPGRRAFSVGAVLFAVILFLGPLTGAGLNPARSVGPALASGNFEDLHVYVVGPLLGASVAGIVLRGRGKAQRADERGRRPGPILFVCIENAGGSQMAEAFARDLGLRATSAGTRPASRVNPVVVEAMKEKGLDLSRNHPRILTPEMIQEASLAVTMGCSVEEVCPRPILAQLQKKLVDWDLDDPKGKTIGEVRKIRDEIERRVRRLGETDHSEGAVEHP